MEVEIEAVDASGDGLAHHDGTRLFVPYSIPGERLRVRVERRHGRDAWATIETIIRPSPHRVTPPCRHFGPPDFCGGCAWQHIAYPEQLRLKTTLVRTLIAARMRGGRAPHVGDTLPSTALDDPWGYRHKVHFVFANTRTRPAGSDARRGQLVMGHYVRGSRRVFMARECPVHDARGNGFAFALRDECSRAGVQAASPASPERRREGSRTAPAGALRHIAIRCGAATGETMATLVVTTESDRRLRAASKRALDGPHAPDSFHLNLHDRADAYIFGGETRHIRGPRHLREQVCGATFLVSPTAFFQTNVHAAEILVRLVLEALPAGKPVLDLYAGVGLFAIPLARRGDRVIAIEENRAATSDGALSLKLNGLPADRCRFLPRRVLPALHTVSQSAATHVVLDPPRDGCEPPVLDDVFGRLRPERAAYVSCNPEALAGDLPRIVRHGYRIDRLQPVDMFPHTAHVESVAVLVRAGTG